MQTQELLKIIEVGVKNYLVEKPFLRLFTGRLNPKGTRISKNEGLTCIRFLCSHNPVGSNKNTYTRDAGLIPGLITL